MIKQGLTKQKFDVLIIGGGVNGAALFFGFCKNVRNASVLLLDKECQLAQINSKATGNSQTLHTGDIETNYTYQQALKLKQGAVALKEYCLSLANRDKIIKSMPKIVLAVGEAEIEILRKRYQQFRQGFGKLEWFDWQDLYELEPSVALRSGQRRMEPIAAMGYHDSFCAINYELLTRSFVEQAEKHAVSNNVDNEVLLSTRVVDIAKTNSGYRVNLIKAGRRQLVECRFLVVSAGAYSLYFAKQLGLAKEYSLISAGGNFYYSKHSLKGKVYTLQDPGLPFAAVHGDYDISLARTRFGPTLTPIAKMERYQRQSMQSMRDYRQCIALQSKLPQTALRLLANTQVRHYLSFNLPLVGRHAFAKQVAKIIPDISADDLTFARGVGGTRPLLVNHKQGQFLFGQARIEDQQSIFNIAPATGASTCLDVALANLDSIVRTLDLQCNALERIDSFCA